MRTCYTSSRCLYSLPSTHTRALEGSLHFQGLIIQHSSPLAVGVGWHTIKCLSQWSSRGPIITRISILKAFGTVRLLPVPVNTRSITALKMNTKKQADCMAGSCCSVRFHNGECVVEYLHSEDSEESSGGREHETDHWTPSTGGADWSSLVSDLTGLDNPNGQSIQDFLLPLTTEKSDETAGACSDFKPGRVKTNRDSTNKRARSEAETRAVAYHEAGHAVVAWRLPFGPTVTEATIVPVGISRGHVRWQERSGLPGHEDLFDLACAELAGMAAESLFLGKVTPLTNISDLQDANHAATKAIADDYVEMHDMIRPELQPAARRTLAQTLVCEAYCKTREFLKSHESDVHLVASALLSQGTLKWRDLHKLLGPQELGRVEVDKAWAKLCQEPDNRPSRSAQIEPRPDLPVPETGGPSSTKKASTWKKDVGITLCATVVGSLCLLAYSKDHPDSLSRYDAIKITLFCLATHIFLSCIRKN